MPIQHRARQQAARIASSRLLTRAVLYRSPMAETTIKAARAHLRRNSRQPGVVTGASGLAANYCLLIREGEKSRRIGSSSLNFFEPGYGEG
jgi:hypothetical protein